MEDIKYRKTTTMKSTESELDVIKEEHDYELMFQRQYAYMLERMRKDIIAYQIKTNEQHESHKHKAIIMNDETDKSRKSKEHRMQAKLKLESLMKLIDQEQIKR